ncbi:MAG: Inner membrane protein YbaN [Lentisphaerae bacterium ADurb.BinA184]|nr:MAG: Inner membrane protein YbaN [Lentisphaerae bacterium ADurb.BinA184]
MRTPSADPVLTVTDGDRLGPGSSSRVRRALLVGIGTAAVGLGVIGIFLPVLPTTPFLLLAAACYARGSRRFYVWLMTNRWCGESIRNYREGRGVPLRQKVLTLALLWITIGATACLAVSLWWVRLLLLAVAVGVTIHLLMLKTLKPDATCRGAGETRESPDP